MPLYDCKAVTRQEGSILPKEEVICALILAAGLSTRMGEFKQLMELRGKTVLENTVDSALEGGADSVLVVTGYHAGETEKVLAGYGDRVSAVRNEQFATTDMMQSIKVGVSALPECSAFFLLPGDMPVVSSATFRALRQAARTMDAQVIFPTLDGYRKHPPLIRQSLIPEILAFNEDGGLRRLWERHKQNIATVPVDDPGVWIDLDTQKDYKNCKQKYEKLDEAH